MAESQKDTLATLARLLEGQQIQMQRLTDIVESMAAAKSIPKSTIEVKKATIVELSTLMDTYTYDPVSGRTFDAWYERNGAVFKKEAEGTPWHQGNATHSPSMRSWMVSRHSSYQRSRCSGSVLIRSR